MNDVDLKKCGKVDVLINKLFNEHNLNGAERVLIIDMLQKESQYEYSKMKALHEKLILEKFNKEQS